MPPRGIPRKKEIDPFLDTVCPLRASHVINVPICDYEEEKKEIDQFLDTVCPFRASRVKNKKQRNSTETSTRSATGTPGDNWAYKIRKLRKWTKKRLTELRRKNELCLGNI